MLDSDALVGNGVEDIGASLVELSLQVAHIWADVRESHISTAALSSGHTGYDVHAVLAVITLSSPGASDMF